SWTRDPSIQILKSESPLVIVIPHRQCFPACVRLRLVVQSADSSDRLFVWIYISAIFPIHY
uniref:Ovule protein n=1 Tax=Mesocestoides corti TaxID=53468 RepID=A0A5K3ESZ1_MESCO